MVTCSICGEGSSINPCELCVINGKENTINSNGARIVKSFTCTFCHETLENRKPFTILPSGEILCSKVCVDGNANKRMKMQLDEAKSAIENEHRATVAQLHEENMREVERARSLDETTIADKLASTFCYPPDLTVDQMDDKQIVKHLQNLQEMINVIRTHVHAVEREMHENKKRDKKLMQDADKEYKAKNEPKVVDNKFNEQEKVLWKLAKEHGNEDDDETRDIYNALKAILRKSGKMKDVFDYIDENFGV